MREGPRADAEPMSGLDTNVLARYIVQDDPDQSAAAVRLIEGRCTAQTPASRPSWCFRVAALATAFAAKWLFM